eukprot:3205386-Rhodomonas_salina.3
MVLSAYASCGTKLLYGATRKEMGCLRFRWLAPLSYYGCAMLSSYGFTMLSSYGCAPLSSYELAMLSSYERATQCPVPIPDNLSLSDGPERGSQLGNSTKVQRRYPLAGTGLGLRGMHSWSPLCARLLLYASRTDISHAATVHCPAEFRSDASVRQGPRGR